MMQIAVLADTHIPKRARTLPPEVWALIGDSDAIIHAGDVVDLSFLDQLKAFKIVYAVRGNNDVAIESLPEELQIVVEGVCVAVVHDSGEKTRRSKRMRSRFPEADIVVFGHSHMPVNETADSVVLFNPGSPTDKRRQPQASMGWLTLHDGVIESRIIDLD